MAREKENVKGGWGLARGTVPGSQPNGGALQKSGSTLEVTLLPVRSRVKVCAFSLLPKIRVQ